MAFLGAAAQQTNQYTQARAAAQQHARVSLERMQRIIREATVAPNYPGIAVVYDQIGTYLYPDTLIVWHPASGTPANAAGPPLVSECVFYCPDPANPSQLVELTAPTNLNTLSLDPTVLNTTSGRTTVNSIKTASSSVKTLLTDLLRTFNPSGSSSATRGCVRFNYELNPSAAEWTSYKAGSLLWKNMSWPTVMYSSAYGTRHIRVQIELHLVAHERVGSTDNVGLLAYPFFGSATLHQGLTP
jgi:hypothetical protein